MKDLRTITDFAELIAYLRDELDWPVEDYQLDQLTFEYDADELGLKDEEVEKLKDGIIRQLRPLPGGQPFGIFFVEFGQAKLPVVVLRRILNALVIKKRNSANPADRQRWDAADILFISAFGQSDDREIAFAHFHKDPDTTELPILRVLGWDGSDTPLKTKHVAEVLKTASIGRKIPPTKTHGASYGAGPSATASATSSRLPAISPTPSPASPARFAMQPPPSWPMSRKRKASSASSTVLSCPPSSTI
jgi:hypothetical protein